MSALELILGLVTGAGVGTWFAGSLMRRRPTLAVTLRCPDAVPRSFEEVLAAVRAAALAVELRGTGGFLLHEQPRHATGDVLLAVADDAARVTPASLRVTSSDTWNLPGLLALALVPLFGAIDVTCQGETFRVDGTLDRLGLRRAQKERLDAKLARLTS